LSAQITPYSAQVVIRMYSG